MAWIESHDWLEDHPKLGALAEAMGWLDVDGCVDPFKASGHLHRFWKWCLRYAPTGDLHAFNDGALARAAGLSSALGQRFVAAMTADASRWIDRGRGPQGESIFRVHDWLDFTKRYLKESRFKDKPEKWREVEAVYAVPMADPREITESPKKRPVSTPEKLRSSSGTTLGIPNPTKPNQNTPAASRPGPPTDAAKRRLWDALLGEFRLDPKLPQEDTRYRAVVKALHAKGAQPPDIAVRARRYRREWKVECTPEALVKWWDRFAPPPRAETQPETTEEREARERAEAELREWLDLPAEERQQYVREQLLAGVRGGDP